jgi:hypothetical protein
VSSPPYIYNLPSGYFKKEITGQHWSGPKGQIDYKIKEKKKGMFHHPQNIPSIIRTQRLMEQQEYSIIIRRPKEQIH